MSVCGPSGFGGGMWYTTQVWSPSVSLSTQMSTSPQGRCTSCECPDVSSGVPAGWVQMSPCAAMPGRAPRIDVPRTIAADIDTRPTSDLHLRNICHFLLARIYEPGQGRKPGRASRATGPRYGPLEVFRPPGPCARG